ncbi:hypothetical protein DMJ13_20295 [halophilic archaeon]|nr:hypothetical protein DMJ13_20295 [halophilic archaeon]
MAVDLSDRVREIADARGESGSEVFEQALERGIIDLWETVVLGKYVDGELSRDQAVELVGVEKVKRADRESAAVKEDIDWGLNA